MLRSTSILLSVFLFCSLAAAESTWRAETLDELAAMADDEACGACHAQIHQQWRQSWHSRSVLAATGILTEFIESGLAEDWQTPLTKSQLMKCLHCHAPAVALASEELAVSIGEMIVAAETEPDSVEGQAAHRQLEKLNVGCTDCHVLAATTYLTETRGEPRRDAVYSPNGKDSPAHPTIAAVQMRRSLFCEQCHGTYVAPDGELLTCATLPGSYRNTYQSRGGAQTCQDCHMRENGRGHLMPGGHFIDMVRQGLELRLEVAPYRHLPGQIAGKDPTARIPSAVVTAYVENRAGHRVPDG